MRRAHGRGCGGVEGGGVVSIRWGLGSAHLGEDDAAGAVARPLGECCQLEGDFLQVLPPALETTVSTKGCKLLANDRRGQEYR